MKLTIAQVEHIAELAKLDLTPEERELFREQLSQILEYADLLSRLDTSGVQPTTSVLGLQNVMRADEVIPSQPAEDVLKNAPDAEDNLIRVRAILD